MPFEIAPQVEAPAKVGKYQHIADLMLRGCAMSQPCYGSWVKEECGQQFACAMGAVLLGGGGTYPRDYMEAAKAYSARYGSGIMGDNDSGEYTREQIAARIAAL